MSNKVDLELLKKSKQEEELLELLNGIRVMKTFYDQMKGEGFSDEFIAIFLAYATKKDTERGNG